MIKPNSNAPAPMQPWVRTTDQQIRDLENTVARLESSISGTDITNHEQNNALAQTFEFTPTTDGNVIANASDMNFTGSVTAQNDVNVNGSVAVGNPSRILYDQNTGLEIGTIPNFEVVSGVFGVNPVTNAEYFSTGELNITDTFIDADTYGQINGDGLSIVLSNNGQTERQNIAILGVSGDGTNATYQIENNASNVAVYTAGRYVTITGIDPVGYNDPNALMLSVNTSVSPMTFTIANATSASYVGGGYVTINQANSVYEGKLSVQGPSTEANLTQSGLYVGNAGDDITVAPTSVTSTAITAPVVQSDSSIITGTRVFVSNTAPTAISNGDLWIDSNGSIPIGPADIPINYQAKNALINGAFDIWQRGTSFSASGYTADRWAIVGASGQTVSSSRQSFTAGAAPVAGYEGTYYSRVKWNGTPSGTFWYTQRVEDVRAFAGQNVVLSYWAKASSATSALNMVIEQNFGTGGSSPYAVNGSAVALTTSWKRYQQAFNIPSISGKTIGTNSFLDVRPFMGSTTVNGIDIDIWGAQLELGITASPFNRSAPTLDAELSACQRYYQRLFNDGDATAPVAFGYSESATVSDFAIPFPVQMRIPPAAANLDWNALAVQRPGTGSYSISTITQSASSSNGAWVQATTSSTSGSASQSILLRRSTTAGYIAFTAEL